jgi:hypothetical protein
MLARCKIVQNDRDHYTGSANTCLAVAYVGIDCDVRSPIHIAPRTSKYTPWSASREMGTLPILIRREKCNNVISNYRQAFETDGIYSLSIDPQTTMSKVAIGPRIKDSSHQFKPLLPFAWAKPALMRESVNHPTAYSLALESMVDKHPFAR